MLKGLLREAAEVASRRAAPSPEEVPATRKAREKKRSRTARYPRGASDSERTLLREAVCKIADHIDEGIVALEGTNEAWAVYEAEVLSAGDVAPTTPPNRFSAWRRLLPEYERIRVRDHDVQLHYSTDTVDGVHVRRLSVSIHAPDGRPLVDGANPPREAIGRLPEPSLNVRSLLRQLWRLVFHVLITVPRSELQDLAIFVRKLRKHILQRKRIRVVVTNTSISIFIACSAWVTWEYAHITDGAIRAVVTAGPTYDNRTPGTSKFVGWAALLRWTDPSARPDEIFVIYRDGSVVAEVTASEAWYAPERVYQWSDRALKFGENHTYRLGKKFVRVSTIYVTSAMDLKPCWRCLEDVMRGRFAEESEQIKASEPPREFDERGMYAEVGVPIRFGGRIDSRTSAPNPHIVPPPIRVEVNFGDASPVRTFNSDNVVHTYLTPGTYEIRMRPLDPSVLTPSPRRVRVVGSKKDFPRARWVDLTIPAKSGRYEVALAAVPGQTVIIPLKWWLTQVLHDIGGDYLENIEIGIAYGDESPMDFIKLSDITRKLPDETYEIASHPRHTWRKPGSYMLEIMAFSHEHGTFYKTIANVIVFDPGGDMEATLRRAYATNPMTIMWRIEPSGTREGYVRAPRGRTWRASIRPWLDLVHEHTGADPRTLAVVVDYGNGTAVPATNGEMGHGIVFDHAGRGRYSWTQVLISDHERGFYYIGETKITIE